MFSGVFIMTIQLSNPKKTYLARKCYNNVDIRSTGQRYSFMKNFHENIHQIRYIEYWQV